MKAQKRDHVAHKRRIYLINPNFQLKLSFYVCFITFLSSIIYPLTIYELISNISNNLIQVSPTTVKALADKKVDLIKFLAVWQVGFTFIIFCACILVSHKVAGPIYKTRKFLKSIKSNNDMGALYFRDGDYFPELAEDYNDAIGHIQENYKKDFVYLSEVNAYINNLSHIVPDDKKIVLTEITKKLNEIQNRFNQSPS